MSRKWRCTAFVIAVLILLLTACNTTPQPTPTPTKDKSIFGCAALALNSETACLNVPPSSMVLQTSVGSEITLEVSGANLTLNGTALLTAVFNYNLTIATIEGVTVVGAFGATRIVQAGAQVTLRLGGDTGLQVTDAPSIQHPVDVLAISNLPLEQLGRAVQLPKPIAPPPGFTPLPTQTFTPTITPTTTGTPTPTETPIPTGSNESTRPVRATITLESPTDVPSPTPCSVREDWQGIYTVQRGDTLGRIAQQFNLSLQELQEANCIADANRIRVGQILRLPTAAFPDVPTALPPTRTPSGVDFRAEQMTLHVGQCTTLRWDVDNVSAVYFEDEVTSEHNARQVCPSATDTYTLLVIYLDGSQVPYTLTVIVMDTTPTPSS